MENTNSLEITLEESGTRLDKLLAMRLPELSRSRVKALILEGAVTVGGVEVDDPARKVRTGEALVLTLPAPVAADPLPENIPLRVVYEDSSIIIIDKPAGLVVHPSAGHETGTLVNALLHHCGASLSGINGVLRPGIVHRLDKDTSGLLIIAKNDNAHRSLAAQFADHGRTGALERLYKAICWGVPAAPTGTVDGAIARSHVNREKMAVVEEDKGRFAITHYETSETFVGQSGALVAALIDCALETGRTHQIRVHMAHIGHPLLGDDTYGGRYKTKANLLSDSARQALETLGRQALHAAVLGFEHPETGAFMRFESHLPEAMAALVTALRAPG